MEKTLKLLNAWRFQGEFFFELLPIRWHLGRKKLLSVSQDLLYWVIMYEKEDMRTPMRYFSENWLSAEEYVWLFTKLPELAEYLVCADGVIGFKDSVPLERRLELSRYVNRLPVRLKY